jgi:alpha-tubulin suppressor-like RCC1 family protein
MVGIRSFLLAAAAAALLLTPSASRGNSLPPLDNIVQVVAGEAHSCALTRGGGVACWGSNEHGELGTGNATLTRRPTPVPVRGLTSGVRHIAAGYFHTCAVLASGGVRCWGWNIFGQLGNGEQSFESVATPVAVVGIEDAVEVSAGGLHTCARNAAGAVRCWGLNENGQVGDGSTVEFRASPVAVTGLGGSAQSLDLGAGYSCAALSDGQARCWGANAFGQLGDGSRTDRRVPTAVQGLQGVSRLGAAARHTCATVADGRVHCWGALIFPNDEQTEGSPVPRPFPGLESGWIDVDSGVFHSCALRNTGEIRCLGTNSLGQLGNGEIGDSFAAEQVIGLDPGSIGIGLGGDHGCAVASSGGVQCWGRNNDGQLGIDRTSERLVPTPVATLGSGVQTVGAGSFHGCALSAGIVKCWGANNQDQIGDGTQRNRPIAVEVQGLGSGVRQLGVGHDHACAIVANRSVRCWGANFDGRLGDGTQLNQGTAVPVLGLGGPVAALAQGQTHGCALLESGEVRCWGVNDHGQLGNGSNQPSFGAVPVSGLGSVRAISAGFFHTCAITTAGALKCWGLNDTGQLGDGSTSSRNLPVDVVGLGSGVRAVGTGFSHSCAVRDTGAVSCWGASFFGRLLGDESPDDRAVPGPVPSLTADVLDISLGGFHSCVRMADASMRCWGENNVGAIGDNSRLSRGVPTQVAGLTAGVSQIDVGFGGQTCAVVDGGAKCWGENTFGQLGDGSTYGVATPQRVVVNTRVRRVLPIAAEANAASGASKSSASGRYVVFQSQASNLVGGDSNGGTDIFRRDRESGRIERVSLDDGGGQIGGDSVTPAVSADGQRVVFVAPTAAVAKLRGESGKQAEARRKGGGQSLLLRNMLTGATHAIGPVLPADSSSQPQISAAGNAISYTAPADAGSGQPGQPNVFLVPLLPLGDELQPGTPVCVSCKSVAADGSLTASNADGASGEAQVSADGRYVTYSTQAKNTLAQAPAPCPQGSSAVILRDMLTGVTQQLSPPTGTPDGACGSVGSVSPTLSFDGQTVAFSSDQSLDDGDANGVSDVYVWQAGSADLSRVSVAPDGSDSVGASFAPSLSGDGSQLAFVSAAPNLDLSFADSNDSLDLHAVDLQSGALNRLSQGASGAETASDSLAPALNFDGTRILFETAASAVGQNGLTGVVERLNPNATVTRSATWWIDVESGWGLSIFDQGSVLVPAWFTYDSDGEPTWFFVPGAFPQADGSYRGSLQRLSGVRFDQISGPAVLGAQTIGSATFRFIGDDVLQFDYVADGVSQGKRMTRFPFGNRTFACSATPDASRSGAGNVSDIWTGAGNQTGWGLTLFQIGDSLFGAWYTYDVDGEALFYVIASSRQPNGNFAGSLFRQRNGVPFSQIDGQAPSPGNDVVGSVNFSFSDGANGVFRYVLGGVDQSKPIVRLLVGDRATECAGDDLSAQQ